MGKKRTVYSLKERVNNPVTDEHRFLTNSLSYLVITQLYADSLIDETTYECAKRFLSKQKNT